MLTVRFRVAARGIDLGREVDGRITVEEAKRHELEPGHDARLHGEVLDPNGMMKTKDVPEHDIRVLDRAILGNEGANVA